MPRAGHHFLPWQRNLSGPRIREARRNRNPPWNQAMLLERMAQQGIKMDQSTLTRIERQERCVLDLELQAFARCLNTTIAWLCGEKGARSK